MDTHVQWAISADVEGLVKVITDCRKQLIDIAKRKHNKSRVTVVACDAYADPKVVELLRLSEAWIGADPLPAVINKRTGEEQVELSERVATFDSFQLHTHPIMGERDIRLIMELGVGDDRDQLFFGNIALTDGTTP